MVLSSPFIQRCTAGTVTHLKDFAKADHFRDITSISDFSTAAVVAAMGQALGRIDIETPKFSTVEKEGDCEVREYEPCVVAEVSYSGGHFKVRCSTILCLCL